MRHQICVMCEFDVNISVLLDSSTRLFMRRLIQNRCDSLLCRKDSAQLLVRIMWQNPVLMNEQKIQFYPKPRALTWEAGSGIGLGVQKESIHEGKESNMGRPDTAQCGQPTHSARLFKESSTLCHLQHCSKVYSLLTS